MAGGSKLRELGQRQNVAVGVGEPSNPISAGSDPHAVIILLQTVVTHEYDPSRLKQSDGLADASNAPAKDRVPGLGCFDAQHRAVGVEHAGKRVLLHHS